jgi:hypothetical protein
LRDLGDGEERITDPDELRAVRRLMLRVFANTFLTAAIATGLFVLAR